MSTTHENLARQIGQTISIRWGTSRGRDSCGYTTCSLRNASGQRVAACNGGGYDMRGTVVGSWLAREFRAELLALKPEAMPEHSHWEPKRARVCGGKCAETHHDALMAAIAKDQPHPAELPDLPEDCWECPACGGRTHASRDGRRVQDGRYFYGLTFHDPNFDPGKAVIGSGCDDRTLTAGDNGSEGRTVAEAEAAGNSFGLERYQAVYRASSKFPTARHTVPSIDGACGMSSVMEIARAIGLDLRQIHNSAKLDIYEIVSSAKEHAA